MGKRHEDSNSQLTSSPQAPVATARRLVVGRDYLPSVPKLLSVQNLLHYNTILQDTGKEAADKWLTELWS